MTGQVLLITIGLIIAIDVVLRGYFVAKVLKIFETRPPFNVPIYPPCADAETLEIPSTSGLTLRGSLYKSTERPSRGTILFFAELDGTHWSAMSYAESLVSAGFDLLAFDFRNQGESDVLPGYHPLHWPTRYELEDGRAALNYLRSRADLNHSAIGVMGVSRGSQVAFAIAGENPDIRAVCCEGAYSTSLLMMYFAMRWAFLFLPDWVIRLVPRWHFELTLYLARRVSERQRRCKYLVAEKWLRRIGERPVLLIAGERDNYVHPEISEGLQQQIGCSAQIWYVPHAKHNRAREVDAEEYDRRITDFFVEQLQPAGTALPVAV